MSGVLVVAQRSGADWHRMSWETLAAAQQFGASLGVPVEAAVVGSGVGALAADAATKNVAKVYAVEHDLLKDYTADGYSAAVEELIREQAWPSDSLTPRRWKCGMASHSRSAPVPTSPV